MQGLVHIEMVERGYRNDGIEGARCKGWLQKVAQNEVDIGILALGRGYAIWVRIQPCSMKAVRHELRREDAIATPDVQYGSLDPSKGFRHRAIIMDIMIPLRIVH